MEKEDPSDTPDISPTLRVSSVPTDIKPNDSLQQAISTDLNIANDMVSILYQTWARTENPSVQTVVSLARATMETVKARRELLCLPYGAPSSHGSDSRASVITPLD